MLLSFSNLPDDIIYILGKSLNEQSPADAYAVMLLVSAMVYARPSAENMSQVQANASGPNAYNLFISPPTK